MQVIMKVCSNCATFSISVISVLILILYCSEVDWGSFFYYPPLLKGVLEELETTLAGNTKEAPIQNKKQNCLPYIRSHVLVKRNCATHWGLRDTWLC